MAQPAEVFHRLNHYTPLRYPGGKGKLAGFVKELIEVNDLHDCQYAEPYAGGAAIALELLFHEFASHIHINDISRPVHSFWKSVLDRTDDLVRLIVDTPLTVRSWDRQKKIFSRSDDYDDLAVGFATFFLNRTNRSGILNGGIIGGRDQTGPWKIDARFNAPELVRRIEAIASLRRRITLSQQDARLFLLKGLKIWPLNTLIYLDPPYYLKGKTLYYDFYGHEDHETIAKLVTKKIKRQRWIVSYDNVKEIRAMYSACPSIVYGLGYSAREVREGAEVMFFANELLIPKRVGAMKVVQRGKR
jgi:DNA adenine methylase